MGSILECSKGKSGEAMKTQKPSAGQVEDVILNTRSYKLAAQPLCYFMVTVTTLVPVILSSLSNPTKLALSHFNSLAISHPKPWQKIPEHFNTEKFFITQLRVKKILPGSNLSFFSLQ